MRCDPVVKELKTSLGSYGLHTWLCVPILGFDCGLQNLGTRDGVAGGLVLLCGHVVVL